MIETPPLALYLHIPWCVKKCPYCDFNSHSSPELIPEQEYIAAVLADLRREVVYAPGRELSSIFIGGGTPSLFSGRAMQDLLDGVRHTIALQSDCEITMEANPGTAEAERFSAYRAAGVNRLSLGVQSLSDHSLGLLGRIHGADEAVAAFNMARTAGFNNINLDMMFGLPQQQKRAALDDLRALIELNSEHISWYQLTLEPNTLFHRQVPSGMPDDDLLADVHEEGLQLLAASGYGRYEVSAFARAGRQCLHNLNYWRFGDYLAAGAGAHGKLTIGKSINRVWKQRHPRQYMTDKDPTGERFVVPTDQLPFEFMLNALRLVNGVEIGLFARRTGLSLSAILSCVQQLQDRGLLESTDAGRLVCTKLGLNYLDDVLQSFLESN